MPSSECAAPAAHTWEEAEIVDCERRAEESGRRRAGCAAAQGVAAEELLDRSLGLDDHGGAELVI